MTNGAKIGILWRGNRDAPVDMRGNRLRPLFDAFAALRVDAEPVVFSDEAVEAVREQLQRLDGVLVWVDPIMGEQDRTKLDALLRDVSAAGVWVSAHPDVILKMGTKEVLYRTRDIGWGGDVQRYATLGDLREQLPARLANGPRVLKQYRGNGGIGVWKVELVAGASSPDPMVRVQHARDRGTETEDMPVGDFADRCQEYFAASGPMIDQPFQPRIVEGMIRCYMIQDKLIGFAHQAPEGLTEGSPADNVLGLPAKKTMFEASEPRFKTLRDKMESEWVPAMERLLDIDTKSLPAIWDADFLYGPKDADGADTYVLCEINVSSVLPFPDHAVGPLAQAALARALDAKNR